jgi:hypothetical protein
MFWVGTCGMNYLVKPSSSVSKKNKKTLCSLCPRQLLLRCPTYGRPALIRGYKLLLVFFNL